MDLNEITITANPAYSATQVDVRSCPEELRSLLNGKGDRYIYCDDSDNTDLLSLLNGNGSKDADHYKTYMRLKLDSLRIDAARSRRS